MPIHMRMRKLRGPHMKKSMPFEPFRTHTQPVNLCRPRGALRQGRRGHPRDAGRQGPGHAQGRPGQGPRQGRAHQAAHGPRPRVQRGRQGGHRGRRRHLRRGRLTSGRVMLSTILSAFTVAEIRKKLLFTALLLALYRVGSHIPVPGINVQAVNDIQKQFGGGEHPRPAEPVQRRRPEPDRALRAGDHALHHGVDHPAAADGRRAVAGEALEGGRGRPGAHHAVHALPHRRPGVRAVDRLRLPLQALHGQRRRSRSSPSSTRRTSS